MNFNKAEFETSVGTAKGLFQSDKAEVCFSGHSNVGKSSLINKVFNRKSFARTSNKPGKTATVNFFKCENVRLADLPGYGFAKVSFEERQRWGELMEGYFSSGRDIRLVFQLIDARHKPTKDDIDMLHFLCDNNFPFVVVLTKIDKLKKSEREKNLVMLSQEMDFIGDIAIIPFSAENGEGCDVIRQLLSDINEEEN
jgi:GTP-binding protein